MSQITRISDLAACARNIGDSARIDASEPTPHDWTTLEAYYGPLSSAEIDLVRRVFWARLAMRRTRIQRGWTPSARTLAEPIDI